MWIPKGKIRVNVPMFYRMRGIPALTNNTPPPTNMVLIPAGAFTMGDSLLDSYSGSGANKNSVQTTGLQTTGPAPAG